MKVLFPIALVSLFATHVIAAGGDMKLGSHSGMFCGAPATFEVLSKTNGKWIFEGKIHIHDTGEYDRIWIEQYENNSLRVIRYPSGGNTGKTQTIETQPPKFRQHKNGQAYVEFFSRKSHGPGCHPQHWSRIYVFEGLGKKQ